MEFHEKLQQLRTKKNLTQDQLASELYVSRTAISKWESGKGYPNIESLKGISALFSVTIDELLSQEELITLAETENRININKIYNIISGIIDVMAVMFIVLPIYGKPQGDYVYRVSLLSNTHTPNLDIVIHWTIFLFMIGLGVVKLIAIFCDKETWYQITSNISIVFGALAICLFAAAREPYATILLFLFLAAKVFLVFQQNRLK